MTLWIGWMAVLLITTGALVCILRWPAMSTGLACALGGSSLTLLYAWLRGDDVFVVLAVSLIAVCVIGLFRGRARRQAARQAFGSAWSQ